MPWAAASCEQQAVHMNAQQRQSVSCVLRVSSCACCVRVCEWMCVGAFFYVSVCMLMWWRRYHYASTLTRLSLPAEAGANPRPDRAPPGGIVSPV